RLAACRCQSIQAAPASADLAPRPLNPPAIFKAVQHGVDRRDTKRQHAAGPLGDRPAQVIAVQLGVGERGQHEQLRGALARSGVGDRIGHMYESYIYESETTIKPGRIAPFEIADGSPVPAGQAFAVRYRVRFPN